ncbi:Forkhead box protein K2 [Ceratocystis platani]|uniref:Forkhead box protein K2 n=2 Tax=Ceratocystis TaxID=5157 RepID=A0A0F8B6P6_CERFI|nr:Forkhead box protein K2 [Ceratocystis platani]
MPSSRIASSLSDYASAAAQPRYPGSIYQSPVTASSVHRSPLASSPLGPSSTHQISTYDDEEGLMSLESHHSEAAKTQDGPEKVEEPYAQLIYRAFMSVADHALTLQEIYQWFRENTDKPRSGGKGWQNSIRHNLSMNGAFVKRDRKPSSANLYPPGAYPPASNDSKKSTVWVLEPWAAEKGVQSTTRYRKDNSVRRAISSSGLSSSSAIAAATAAALGGYHSSSSSSRPRGLSSSHTTISSRALSGRKGGCATSNNARVRKREGYALNSGLGRYYSGAHGHAHHGSASLHYSGSGSGAAYGSSAGYPFYHAPASASSSASEVVSSTAVYDPLRPGGYAASNTVQQHHAHSFSQGQSQQGEQQSQHGSQSSLMPSPMQMPGLAAMTLPYAPFHTSTAPGPSNSLGPSAGVGASGGPSNGGFEYVGGDYSSSCDFGGHGTATYY